QPPHTTRLHQKLTVGIVVPPEQLCIGPERPGAIVQLLADARDLRGDDPRGADRRRRDRNANRHYGGTSIDGWGAAPLGGTGTGFPLDLSRSNSLTSTTFSMINRPMICCNRSSTVTALASSLIFPSVVYITSLVPPPPQRPQFAWR